MPLYNVNLKTGDCIDERKVEWDGLFLDDVIANLRSAAEGLLNVTIDINSDTDSGFGYHELCVSGHRQLTDVERRQIVSDRQREQRRRNHMAAFRG